MRLAKVLLALLFGYVNAYSAFAAPSTTKDIGSNNANKPLALDSRIKTYIYSENEVFRLVVHYGYQTSIEFAEGEDIQTISLGNNYAWQLTPIGRRLFVKPLEENILTNMTILTNKRAYHFDIESKLVSYAADDELVYVVRFYFPDSDFDAARPLIATSNNQSPTPIVKPFNFNYTLSGPENLAPTKVFDDGTDTFFKFPEGITTPNFTAITNAGSSVLTPRQKGEYVIVNSVAPKFKLDFGGQNIDVFNESMSSGGAK